MKHLKTFFIAAMMLLACNPLLLAENVEFDNEKAAVNFTAMRTGINVVHFRVLFWADGTRIHWAGDNDAGEDNLSRKSYVYFRDRKTDKRYKLFAFYSNHDDGDNGKVKIRLDRGTTGRYNFTDTLSAWSEGKYEFVNGTLKLTNCANGDGVIRSEQFEWYQVRKSGGNAYIELDWEVGPSFEGKELEFVCEVYDEVTGVDDGFKKRIMGDFTGPEPQPRPNLGAPIFYPQDMYGKNQIGMAGLSYAVMQKPYYYSYILNGVTHKEASNERGGIIAVPLSDTTVQDFKMNFEIQYGTSNDIHVVYTTNTVTIPAYHTIQNYQVAEYVDAQGFNKGYNRISWDLHHIEHKDINIGDMFELQRAFKADFSDATPVMVEPMHSINYNDTILSNYRIRHIDSVDHYVYIDSVPTVRRPGHPDSTRVYYRVRRGSSTLWGWTGHAYAASGAVEKKATLPAIVTNPMIDTTATFSRDFGVDIRIPLILGEDGGYWRETGALLKLTRYEKNANGDTLRTIEQTIPEDSIRLDPTDPNHRRWIAHYVDHAASTCTYFAYRVKVDDSRSALQSIRADISYDGATATVDGVKNGVVLPIAASYNSFFHTSMPVFAELEADQGKLANRITVRWAVPGAESFLFDLHRHFKNDDLWVPIFTNENNVLYYNDTDVAPGEEYTYRVTIHNTCNNASVSQEVNGSAGRYGSIAGRIHFIDGTAEAGVQVMLLDVNNNVLKTVDTDESGRYKFDSIYCAAGGNTVIVNPQSAYGVFQSDLNGQSTMTVNVNGQNPYHDNVDFLDTKSYLLSGRVLYDQTTVPVPNAEFRVNGSLVKDRAGAPVRTAADGSFTLTVPAGNISVQVVKQNHKFKNNGFFELNDSTVFALTKNEYGLHMWDQTKVKLVGRICGGMDQARLPLQQSLSHNNLGDNLNFVLELEGDNISQLVWNEERTLSYIDSTYQHPVSGHTHQYITKDRITITVDSATGEFEAHVLPVKYKVTQMNAFGYSTLFNHGESMLTLDLTAANPVDSFIHAYRTPVVSRITQLKYGVLPQPFYGAESIQGYDTMDSTYTFNLVNIVKDQQGRDSVAYAFDYPVFTEGYYSMQISAHEDYYYNNDKTGRHDSVMLAGSRVKFYNGLKGETAYIETELDSLGQAIVQLQALNTTFSLTDEDALRTLSVSVLVNGEYVDSDPLRVFVTGTRKTGNDFVQVLGKTPILSDILHDPYGANSYAYVEAGSTYTASYSFKTDFAAGININLGSGTSMTNVLGTVVPPSMVGQVSSYSNGFNVPIPVVCNWHWSGTQTYSYKTSKRVETSSDPYYVGANADVYIGREVTTTCSLKESFRIIDEETHTRVLPGIGQGTVRIVREGRDTNGKKYYLAIGQELELNNQLDAEFAYTQEFIRGVLIPELRNKRDALIQLEANTDSTYWANRAKQLKRSLYISSDTLAPEKYGTEKSYRFYPGTDVSTNEVAAYNTLMFTWEGFMMQNEARKYNTFLVSKPDVVQNISGVTTVSFSETFSRSETTTSHYSGFGSGLKGGASFFKSGGALTNLESEMNKVLSKYTQDKPDGKEGEKSLKNEVEAPGWKFTYSLDPVLDFNRTEDNPYTENPSRTVGYVLKTGDADHLSIEVYRVEDVFSTHGDKAYSEMKEAIGKEDHSLENMQKLKLPADFLFRTAGGATRCVYQGADSAHYLNYFEISPATRRIDKPTLSVDVREISNVPDNGRAIFTLRIANETEIDPKTHVGSPSVFTLKWVEGSNPLGAKVFMDGQAIIDGRNFVLNPGNVIYKTIEVERGVGYDFDDLTLMLMSTCDTDTKGYCSFSVHYMPSSTDLTISSPTDKWVMNTLSPHDSLGYYLPVIIEGFDYNVANFDHIEFQYKLATDPDEKWVNQCSYYVNDSLYQLASGNKQLFRTGRISDIRFYGERDPMEQHYDLRAVSFCRHGSGFVTKASRVLSGTKDTRVPDLFGNALPADGILTFDKSIEIPYSEPIAYNYLDEDNNFEVLGIVNREGITSGTALAFRGTKDSYGVSSARRSLNQKSFTIDMIVRPEAPNRAGTFFSHGSGTSNRVVFGMTAEGALQATIGETTLYSEPLDPMLDFTRVVMVYDAKDSTVIFYTGNLPHRAQSMYDVLPATTNDYLYLGANPNFPDLPAFAGRMLEARLWGEALTPEQVTQTNNHRLTGYEHGLIAYYPMNDGMGSIAEDKANGAHLNLNGLTWLNPDGMALHLNAKALNGEGVHLKDEVFSVGQTQDMTLGFWFKLDTILTEKDTMALFSNGIGRSWEEQPKSRLFIGLEGKQLALRQNTFMQSCGRIDDANWHRVAITLSRSHNLAAVYLDGKQTAEFPADSIHAIAGPTYLGACHYVQPDLRQANGDLKMRGEKIAYPFSGCIDQLQLWEQALTLDFINQFAKAAPHGTEKGLIVYLPFHRMKDNGFGHPELAYSPYNVVIMPGKDHADSIILSNGVDMLMDKNIYAPVRQDDQLSKLKFSWLGQENRLVVNLDVQDKEINKNTVYLTVRDVKDLNGNPQRTTMSYNIFVDKNRLRWADRIIDLELPYGHDTIFTETIYNRCGTYTGYTLSSMASWLDPVSDMGNLNAAEEARVQLRVNSSLDPGEYSTFVYLTDQSGLSEPLLVNLRVYAQTPNWRVDPIFTENMTLVGQVQISENNVYSYDTDEEDIVAAFIGQNCVGLQKNSFRNGKSSVYLIIRGIDALEGQKVNFKLWRAKTGRIYNITTPETIIYHVNASYGAESPIVLRTLIQTEILTLHLNPGWNWFSLGLKLMTQDTIPGGNPNTVFTDHQIVSSGDQIKSLMVQTGKRYLADFTVSGGDPHWKVMSDSTVIFDHTHCYAFYCKKGGDIYAQGDKLDVLNLSMTLHRGWNELPYWPNFTQSITAAMTDYYNHAQAGDLIKGYNEFAVFTKDGNWEGSLQYMRPGQGYMMLRGSDASDVQFSYVNRDITREEIDEPVASVAAMPTYSDNMPTVVRVAADFELMPGDRIEALNLNTGRTASVSMEAGVGEHHATLYLMTFAEDGDQLAYQLVRNGQVIGISTQEVRFSHTTSVGVPESPLELDFRDDRAHKLIRNGHLYILRDGKIFDATGKVVTKF